MDQREILFIIRMRNEARQAVQQFGADLGKMVAAAKQLAAQSLEAGVGIEIIGKEAKVAQATLNGLAGSMRSVGAAGVSMNKGLTSVGAGFKNAHTHANGFFGSLKQGIAHMLGFLSVTGGFALAEVGVHKYFELATDYQNLQGKLSLVTKNGAEHETVNNAIFAQAMKTHQSVDDVGEAFYKGKSALGQVGYSDQKILDLSQVINQANLISHARPQAAKMGTYELMQGIGAGTLNGRELRFVAQDSIRLAKALADGLTATAPQLAEQYGHIITAGAKKGMKALTPGDLKDMASKHLLTGTMVADALISQKENLAGEATKVPLTLPRVGNDLHTSAVKAVGEFDAKNGISEAVVNGIERLAQLLPTIMTLLQPVADTIQVIANALGAVGSMVQGSFGLIQKMLQAINPQFKEFSDFMGGEMVKGIIAAATAFGILSVVAAGVSLAIDVAAGAIDAFTVALAANPLTVWITAIALAIGAFVALQGVTVSFGGKTATVGNIIAVVWERTVKLIVNLWNAAWPTISKVITAISTLWSEGCKLIGEAWDAVTGFISGRIDTLHKTFGPVFDTIMGWFKSIPSFIMGLFDGYLRASVVFGAGLIKVAGNVVGFFNKSLGEQIKNFGDTYEKMGMSGLNMFEGALTSLPSIAAKVGTMVHDAYAGSMDEASKRKAATHANAFDMGQSEQTLDPNKAEKEKKAKDLEDRIRSRTDAIMSGLKSVADTYDPVIGNQIKLNEEAAKLKDLLHPDPKNPIDVEALERARVALHLTNQELQQLRFEADKGLDAKSAKAFFKEFLPEAKNLMKEADPVMKSFEEHLKAASDEAGKNAADKADYLTWLKHMGITADQAAEALKNLASGASATAIKEQSEAIKDIMKDYGAKDEFKDQKSKDTLSKLTPGTQAYNDALKDLNVTASELDAAIERMHVRLGEEPNLFKQAAVGAQDYFINLQHNGVQIANVVTNAFKGLEDQLVNLFSRGKMNFRAMLLDLDQQMLRWTIQQGEKGFFGMIQGMAGKGGILGSVGQFFGGAAKDAPTVANTAALGLNNNSLLANTLAVHANTLAIAAQGATSGASSLISSSGTASTFMNIASTVMAAHSGAIAGGYSAWSRSVNPSVFDGARRFHTGGLAGLAGLSSGEVPIIAKHGEAILPTARMPDGNFGIKAMVGGAGGGGMVHFNPILHIHVGGGDEKMGQAHGEAVAKSLLPALQQMVSEQLVSEMRPGGILNGGNKR